MSDPVKCPKGMVYVPTTPFLVESANDGKNGNSGAIFVVSGMCKKHISVKQIEVPVVEPPVSSADVLGIAIAEGRPATDSYVVAEEPKPSCMPKTQCGCNPEASVPQRRVETPRVKSDREDFHPLRTLLSIFGPRSTW